MRIKCYECNISIKQKMFERINDPIYKMQQFKNINDFSCYKCNSKHIHSQGYYQTRNNVRHRWLCFHCKSSFIYRDITYKKRYDRFTIKKILKYWNKEKGYINKFDSFKKSTFSLREIADMLNVSASGVGRIIKSLK